MSTPTATPSATTTTRPSSQERTVGRGGPEVAAPELFPPVVRMSLVGGAYLGSIRPNRHFMAGAVVKRAVVMRESALLWIVALVCLALVGSAGPATSAGAPETGGPHRWLGT